MLVVITANPLDAQRLQDEIAWVAPGLRAHLLPDWETLPYDNFSPHQDLISERLSTLYAISRGETDLVLVPASTALYRMAPPAYLAAYTFFLKQGERLDVEQFKAQMALAGYAHVTQVVSPGEFSVRGGLVDLFPMGSPLPFRIDLFDDEVESIKTFDPDTQRTVYPTKEIRLLPAREFPLDDKGRTRFRSRFRETFEGDPTRASIYKDVSNGIAPAGIEYYLPLFFDETATLLDYLPAETPVLLHRDVPAAIAEFWKDTRSRHDLFKGDRTRPVLPPEQLFLTDEAFFIALKNLPRLAIGAEAGAEAAAGTGDALALPPPEVAVERKATDPLHKLKTFLDGFDGRVLLLSDSPGRRETMAEFFAEYGVKPEASADFGAFLDGDARLALGVAPLARGFVLPTARLAVLTETELYAATARSRVRRDARKAATMEGWLRDLSELKVGDPVVHVSHGIGRYLGLIHMNLGEGDTEFLHLEYNGGDKLYVPVSQLHVITRYAGADPDAIDLHRLGSGQWEKAKKKAAMQVRDTAAELLALYAQRAARPGHRFDFKQHDLEAFAEAFGFETTPDQQSAIDAVVSDMKSGRPMDRLVCGDVGFGKTEVALRAAFIAVADGKQVVVLCPTTLLAEQHYQTFADRFTDWPIKIAELSRFKSAKEQAEALQQLSEGKVDIIIGTHRLLQKDVVFKRLGLVIIDEEHRFGVRQKEALKQLRSEVDILTLTATPIPRTLGLAMEGLREFSVIATPPQKRLSIKTFVQPSSRGVIREAVLREFKRGGQVYFLHNEVDTIDNMRDDLEELLPEARIVVGHGQLPRARARARDARLHPAARQPAAVHHHHRDRHQHPHRQHHHHQPRRPLRPGAAAPAARPRRPQPPPGLRLPADHAGRQAHRAGAEAARSDRDDGRPRLRLLPGDARPRDPRRRRGAGREPVGRDPAGRLQPVHRDAQARGQGPAGRQGARSVAAAGGGVRDQPAHPGAAAHRLLPRRAGAPDAVQAPGQLRAGRRPARAAGGAHRPLRRTPAADRRARSRPTACACW